MLRRARIAAVLAGSFVAFTARAARADVPPTVAFSLLLLLPSLPVHANVPTSTEHAGDWYGWETLALDGAAMTTLFVATLDETPVTPFALLLGAGTFALGAPIVHFAHGNGRAGWGSLGMRVLAPVVAGGLIMLATSDCRGGLCGVDATMVAIAVGGALGVAAIPIDAARARSPRPSDPARLTPILVTNGATTLVGLGATI